ncbi:hypothetical protein, partial [Siphonobacter sp. BAB-5405]|uniref:hypothetical protein n=1 Tax=Siphonobacter sp. BAB-5405 TaxID=1864825 RepID=UPI0018ED458C
MRNIIGPPVSGDDFFGRDQELANAWHLLENGMSLRISAPRRVGKTSFVRRLHQNCESRDWTGFYVNVEDKDNEVGFIEALLENLASEKSWSKKLGGKAKDTILSFIKSIETLKTPAGELKFKWAHDEKTLAIQKDIKELLFTFGEGIIIIDELPVLLNRMLKQENGHQRVTDLLHWLRSLRQLSGVKMYWIFCGSVSLDSFVKRHNLSLTINDTT